MKKKMKVIFALTAFFVGFVATAQEKAQLNFKGKVNGRIFFNYHYDMSDNAEQESSFEIQRAYLGYDCKITDNLHASIILDVGENEAGSDYTTYLKRAQLEWQATPVASFSVGMISTAHFKEQERFWGYRYIEKSFNDKYDFGASADVGVKAHFKLSDSFSAKAFIINGEGYKRRQDEDGKHKYGASLIFEKGGFMAKAYGDICPNKTTSTNDEVNLLALSFFAGCQFSDQFKFASEYNKLIHGTNYFMPEKNKNMDGISLYSTYCFNHKWEVFFRYDWLNSNQPRNTNKQWNPEAGNHFISGIQYIPIKKIKMALNYRTSNFDDNMIENQSLCYVNFEFKF